MRTYRGTVCLECGRYKPGKDLPDTSCDKCGGDARYVEEKGDARVIVGFILMGLALLFMVGAMITGFVGAIFCTIPLAILFVLFVIIAMIINTSDKNAMVKRVKQEQAERKGSRRRR